MASESNNLILPSSTASVIDQSMLDSTRSNCDQNFLSNTGKQANNFGSSSPLSMDRAAFLLIRIKRVFQKKKRKKERYVRLNLRTKFYCYLFIESNATESIIGSPLFDNGNENVDVIISRSLYIRFETLCNHFELDQILQKLSCTVRN